MLCSGHLDSKLNDFAHTGYNNCQILPMYYQILD